MYWIANMLHDGDMITVLALVGLSVLAAILVSLIKVVATDGRGSVPTPRSHPEELGSWIDQRLSR